MPPSGGWSIFPGKGLRWAPLKESEGDAWFGRKTPDQRAFVWLQADAFLGEAAANDETCGNGG